MTTPSPACIYCGAQSDVLSVSHIIPESLGGSDSPVVDFGAVCHKCNQYFGQKVESKALASFPFTAYRAFAGVPSKKGKEAFVATSIGTARTGHVPNRIVVIPRTEEVSEQLKDGVVTQLRVLAHVTQSRAVCQMLLKIGIELLAKHHYDVAVSERLSEAREFARRPKRGASWWALLRCVPEDLFKLSERTREIEIREMQSVLFFVMRLPGVQAMIPLERVNLGSEFQEPEFMTVRAVC